MSMASRLEPLDLTVDVDAPQELNHSSFALAGLFDLQQAGLLARVRLRPFRGMHRGEVEVAASGEPCRWKDGYRAKKTTFLTVHSRGQRIRVAIDFRDAANIFPIDGLMNCDVMFKRSFEPSQVASLPNPPHAVLRPAGLSFAVRSPHERASFGRWLGYWSSSLRGSFRPDREVLARMRRHLREDMDHWLAARYQPSTTSLRAAGSAPPMATGPSTILFQTRTFNRTDDDDANEVHEERAEIIRALRSHFGPSFVGGFIPDELASRRYPDCLTSVPTDKRSYYGAMAGCAVAVYSRGLVGSAAWKLSEYLAHGKCIVGEPVRATLPEPMVDGAEWVTYRNPSECVEKCVRMLADEELRAELAGRARAYYEAHVDPMMAMHRMLAEAVDA